MQYLAAWPENAGAFSRAECPCFVRVSTTPNISTSLTGRLDDDLWPLLLPNALQELLRLLHRAPQVIFAYDVVPVENRAGLVAAHGHGYALGNTGADHVPYCCSSEIVKKPAHVAN